MKFVLSCVAALAACAAMAEDPAPTAPSPPSAAVEKDSVAAAGTEEFRPPPGFKKKVRGKLVLYCIRDSTVGTRFKTEKCYDEAQLRDYIVAQQENKRDIDRVRSTCSTGTEYCRRN